VRAITVQQPWAWAIVHGGKNVENRTQLWRYRGPLAIHAGTRLSDRGMQDQRIGDALKRRGHIVIPATFGQPDMSHLLGAPIHMGALIGVVDLDGGHPAGRDCCQPWGETEYREHDGRLRRDVFHLLLDNPRPLVTPIPCMGHLGLWRLPPRLLDELEVALACPTV
jgi:hypothetical protein